ncbi:MAG: tetratricopeptide repeat protein, partial [Thermodesulfobacteriota bacterium]
MNNKSTVIIDLAAIIILVAAAGGYIIGKGSGNGRSSTSAYSGNGSSRPVLNDNRASLIADLEARLKEDPKDKDAIYGLADTYFSMKSFDDAVKYYKKL